MTYSSSYFEIATPSMLVWVVVMTQLNSQRVCTSDGWGVLDPSNGVFGSFDLAALCGCRTLSFCLFVCLLGTDAWLHAIAIVIRKK